MEAYYLVDMESADYLQYNLVQSALCDPPHRRSVGAQILDRLRRFFLRSIDEAKLRRALAEVLKANAPRQLRSALGQHIEEESAPDRIDWSACIDCYRRCLAELRVRFGLPTGGFVTETRSYRK
jgi:hypothetical protein